MAFSPDGKHVVPGGYSFDATIRIWDARSGKQLVALRGHKDGVNSVPFSPDGRRIISAGRDNTVRVWILEK